MGHICESYRIMGSSEKPCESYRPSLYKICKQQRGQCVDILGASWCLVIQPNRSINSMLRIPVLLQSKIGLRDVVIVENEILYGYFSR